MSKRTILLVDQLCRVANCSASLTSVLNEYAERGDNPKCPASWKAEMQSELIGLTRERNGALKRLKSTVAALTQTELDLIRRLYKPDRLKLQLAEFGVTAPW